MFRAANITILYAANSGLPNAFKERKESQTGFISGPMAGCCSGDGEHLAVILRSSPDNMIMGTIE